jgi:hypothetical protein
MIKMLMTKIREFVTRGVTLTHSNTVSQWVESCDLCKLGMLLKSSSGQNEMSGLNRDLSFLPKEKWENIEYKEYRYFRTFLTSGRTQNFNFEQESYNRICWVLQDTIFNSNRF